MTLENLQNEAAAPIDEATKILVEAAQAQVRRGETVTLEQSKANARERYKAWQTYRSYCNSADSTPTCL